MLTSGRKDPSGLKHALAKAHAEIERQKADLRDKDVQTSICRTICNALNAGGGQNG